MRWRKRFRFWLSLSLMLDNISRTFQFACEKEECVHPFVHLKLWFSIESSKSIFASYSGFQAKPSQRHDISGPICKVRPDTDGWIMVG